MIEVYDESVLNVSEYCSKYSSHRAPNVPFDPVIRGTAILTLSNRCGEKKAVNGTFDA